MTSEFFCFLFCPIIVLGNDCGNSDSSSPGRVLAPVPNRTCAHPSCKRTQRQHQFFDAALLHLCGTESVPIQDPASHDGWKPCPPKFLGAAPIRIVFIFFKDLSFHRPHFLQVCATLMPLSHHGCARSHWPWCPRRPLIASASELAHAASQRARYVCAGEAVRGLTLHDRSLSSLTVLAWFHCRICRRPIRPTSSRKRLLLRR